MSRALSWYDIWMTDPRGVRMALLDKFAALSYANVANNPGWFSIALPKTFDRALIGLDNIIQIYRTVRGGGRVLDFVGFVRRWGFTADETIISGPGLLDLLARRIVAYYAGEAESEMVNDYADDMIKAIVTDNLGGDATDTDRDLSGYNFTISGDLSAAPQIYKAFSWKNVLLASQDIAEASRQNGTELYFYITPGDDTSGLITMQFNTSIDQPGTDRTETSGSPTFFGDNWGNIENALLEYDYTQEQNYVYVGGQGEEAQRTIVEREDTTRESTSVWNRREGWRDARHITGDNETNLLNAEGDAELAENRPKTRFSATLLDSEQSRYGVDWFFGDKVSVSFQENTFDSVIKSIQVSVDRSGKEKINASVEVEL